MDYRKECSRWIERVKRPDLKDELKSMYERRGWGEYRVLDYKALPGSDTNSLIKELILLPGHHVSYQRHKHRTEVWTFTEGEGELILDDAVRQGKRGNYPCGNEACGKGGHRATYRRGLDRE